MYTNTSIECKNAISKASRKFSACFFIGQKKYENIKQYKISSGMSESGEATIGSAVSKSCEISIANLEDLITDGTELSLSESVQISEGIFEDIPMGKFTVVSNTEKDGINTLKAAGPLSIAFEKAYFSNLSYPNNTLNIIAEISAKTGVPIDITGLVSIPISSKPEGYTYREMIGFIAGLYGLNAVELRNGSIGFKWYEYTPTDVLTNRINSPELSANAFLIGKIQCATSKDSSISAGTGLSGISISNPFMTQGILNDIWNKIGNFTYFPASIDMKSGNPCIDPWDFFSYNGKGIICAKVEYNHDGGFMNTISSEGKSEIEKEVNYKGPLAKSMERYYAELVLINEAVINKLSAEEAYITFAKIQQVEAINASIANLSVVYAKITDLDATNASIANLSAIYAKITDLNATNASITNLSTIYAKITDLNATNATITSLDNKYAKIDLANIAAGSITNAMIATGAIGTAQIADGSITDAKIVALTATKITSGTLDAGVINVINLNCANLTVGTINGTQIANGAIDSTKLATAINTAISNAQTTANGKNTVYYSATAPTAGTYKVNDTWFDTDDGNKMYYWNGTAWTATVFGTNALATACITNALIADATIQNAKIANIDAAKITTGYLSADRIAANIITTAKIAANAITTALIAAGAITATQIAVDAVTADKIVSGAITTAKIAAGAVTANEIAANAITAAKIAAGVILATHLGAGSVTSAAIAAGAVTAEKITVGSGGVAPGNLASGKATSGTTVSTAATDGAKTVGSAYVAFGPGTQTNNGAESDYLQIDLGGIYRLAESRLYFYSADARTYFYKIKYSSDGTNWYYAVGNETLTGWAISVTPRSVAIGSSNPTIDSFAVPISARYIRVYANGNTLNIGNHIYEWEVFSTAQTIIDGSSIATGEIKSINYVANTTGMKINLLDGSWDSKYFKINSLGEVTATSGYIGDWQIKDGGLYSTSGYTDWTGVSVSNKSNIRPNYINLRTERTQSGTTEVYNFELKNVQDTNRGEYAILGTYFTSTGDIVVEGKRMYHRAEGDIYINSKGNIYFDCVGNVASNRGITATGNISASGKLIASGDIEAGSGNIATNQNMNLYTNANGVFVRDYYTTALVPLTCSNINLTKVIGAGGVYLESTWSGVSKVVVLENTRFGPQVDGSLTLGHPTYRWEQIYSTNSVISTSDRNKKNSIISLDDARTKALVMGLNPVSYKYNNGTSGRVHYGLISQDVEQLLGQIGVENKDFGGLIKSPKEIFETDASGNPVSKIIENEYVYGLRYEEFIAPMIKVLQIHNEDIEKLKEENRYLKTMVTHLQGMAMSKGV